MDAEFVQHALDMIGGWFLRDDQRLVDLAVAQASGDHARHIPLTWGERRH